VLTGHTVHNGYGAFNALGTLERGDAVVVRTGHGPLRYAVGTVRVYSKPALASHAADVFGHGGRGALVLVTCTGWTGTTYTSNVVVVAGPVSQLPGR